MLPPLPNDVKDAVVTYGTWARRRFGRRLKQLMLYGSYARGEGRRDESDVDVLVVVERLTSREMREIVARGAEIGVDRGLQLSPNPFDAASYERLRADERLLVREIDRDGVAL